MQLVRLMSAFPPKADIVQHDRHVRFVPKDSCSAAQIRLVGAAPREVPNLDYARPAYGSVRTNTTSGLKACREVSEPLRRLIHRKCLNAFVETGQHHNADHDEDDREQHPCVRSA
jgi:hypothetical protein